MSGFKEQAAQIVRQTRGNSRYRSVSGYHSTGYSRIVLWMVLLVADTMQMIPGRFWVIKDRKWQINITTIVTRDGSGWWSKNNPFCRRVLQGLCRRPFCPPPKTAQTVFSSLRLRLNAVRQSIGPGGQFGAVSAVLSAGWIISCLRISASPLSAASLALAAWGDTAGTLPRLAA